MYEDKTLVCKECGQEFVFTAGEQEFYAERGFQNEPQRCKACRDARKAASRGPREYFTATCAACGGEAKVPFEPKSDRPAYCSDCFARMGVPFLRLSLTACRMGVDSVSDASPAASGLNGGKRAATAEGKSTGG